MTLSHNGKEYETVCLNSSLGKAQLGVLKLMSRGYLFIKLFYR